jgi:hypothetical protein
LDLLWGSQGAGAETLPHLLGGGAVLVSEYVQRQVPQFVGKPAT